MVSSFLTKKARQAAEGIDKRYGAGAYGGTGTLYTRKERDPMTAASSGTGKPKVSEFLTKKAKESEKADPVDQWTPSSAANPDIGEVRFAQFERGERPRTQGPRLSKRQPGFQISSHVAQDIAREITSGRKWENIQPIGGEKRDSKATTPIRDRSAVLAELEPLEIEHKTLQKELSALGMEYAEQGGDLGAGMEAQSQYYKRQTEILNRMNVLAQQIKPLEKELNGLKKATEQALIESGEYRPANLLDLTLRSIKQGYYNSCYGQESWKKAQGEENEADKYQELLEGEEFKFIPQGLPGKAVSGVAQLAGQWGRQVTDPSTLALGVSAAGLAAVAGQAGPQVLVPEEIVTVPGAFLAGTAAGSAKANMEIEAGLAYNEMIENGISHDTAYKIAQGVGGINGLIEMVQLDELIKGFKVLSKSGATESMARRLGRVLLDKGIDVAQEVAQETAQEGVTIAGVQLGNQLDKGEWAYDQREVTDRLKETVGDSVLTFGAASIPGTIRNVGAQSNNNVKPKITMAEFTDPQAPIWRNVEYDDTKTKMGIMGETHQEMVAEGKIVQIPKETLEQVVQSYPDLRTMKKKERLPILREKMEELKGSLREFLNRFKGADFELEINGKILDARLYDTGIREVLEKITQDKSAMLYHSDEIFRGARYLYSTPDYDSDPNVYRWNYFYTPVQIGDELVGVRIAVRDMARQQESQIYNWGIKKDVSVDDGGGGQNRKPSGVSLDTPLEAPLDGGGRGQGRISSGVSSDMLSGTTVPQTEGGVKGQDLQPPKGAFSGRTDASALLGLTGSGEQPTLWSALPGLPEQAEDPLMRGALEMAESGALEGEPVIPTETMPVQPQDAAHSGAAPTEISTQETPRSAVPEGEPVGLTVRQRLTLDNLIRAGHSIKRVGMALEKMGPEAIRGVINQGLRAAPDFDSYNRAQTLRRKLNNGESITASELGHLYDALCREPTQWGGALEQTKESTQLKTGEGTGIINSGAISGALNPLGEKASKHAEQYYASIRKMRTDAKKIAENVGYAEEQIQKIKNYLFMDIHDLGDGRISRFDPSYEIAQSWQRLIDGKSIQPHDMTLLLHEIMEQELMAQGYSQDEAHILASRKYDYRKGCIEYYGSAEKDKEE